MNDQDIMNDLTDEALIELTKNGDDAAYQILVKRYIQYIINFVRQYSNSIEEAEDIAQDTFFKAWKHVRSFKSDKKFKTWLFTIARNTAIDYTKKKKNSSFSDMDNMAEDFSFAETLKDPDPLPPELFERSELNEELNKAMTTLPTDHRATLIMHYRDDMTFEDIAFVLKKPMNTVKSWHRRALSKIRQKLTKK